jgi:Ca2+/H+ antiporter
MNQDISFINMPVSIRRLSFVTEQVAEHTNGTIGALLNATFGNAPELLIATAALRSGFYRVVQLAMLGSMLTNLLFVFGLSCLVGGLRWQVQELRITSGNVSVGMMLLAVAGSLLPAGLILGGQLQRSDEEDSNPDIPSKEELQFSRVNATVMMIMYGLYLVFQLGTHKEEFDSDENVVDSAEGRQLHLSPHFTSRNGRQKHARRNFFCMKIISRIEGSEYQPAATNGGDVEMLLRDQTPSYSKNSDRDLALGLSANGNDEEHSSMGSDSSDGSSHKLLPQNEAVSRSNGYFDEYNEYAGSDMETDSTRRRKTRQNASENDKRKKDSYQPGRMLPLGLADPAEPPPGKYKIDLDNKVVVCVSHFPPCSPTLSGTINVFSSRNRVVVHHYSLYIRTE